MIDILDTPPALHKNARETEQLSLEFILPKIKKMRLVVLESIAKATKGLTGSEIVDDVNGYIVSVRPRLTELHAFKLIEPGDKRKNHRGMFETVWSITSKGLQIVELSE